MTLKQHLKKIIYSHGENPLPGCIISILYALLLINAMIITVVYAFLPKMVKTFGASEENAGYYAGLIASSLFLSRIVSNIFWGYHCDKRGKRLPLLLSICCLSISTLLFGFSDTFYWALTCRFIQGFFMSLNVICRAKLAEVCDDTNYALGYSIVLSTSSLGRILGPSLGGFLVFPAEQYPSVFHRNSFFDSYPILLPLLILAIGLAISGFFVIIYIPKDDGANQHGNYEKIEDNFSLTDNNEVNDNKQCIDDVNEEDIHSEENGCGACSVYYNHFKRSSIYRALNKRKCVIGCMFYGLFSYMNVGSNETFPLFAATAKRKNGFGFTTSEIGTILLIASVFLFLFQITLQSRVHVYLGPKKTLVVCNLVLVFSFPLLPLLTNIKDRYMLYSMLCLWVFITRALVAMCELAVNILVKNSVPSSLLGSATGISMAANSIGSVLSPTIYGSAFAWSLTNIQGNRNNINNIGFPFNQYFIFFLQSLWSFMIATLAGSLLL